VPRILLVEDNAMNRDMLSRRLERRGFQVLHAENGAEGVQLARSASPDLVVMDMSLPVMDGYEATRLIKAEGGPRVPVLGLSAHAMAGDAEKALDAGCDDYDTKPIDFRRLLEKIDALLAQRAAAAAPAAAAAVPRIEPAHLLIVGSQALLRDVLVHRLARLEATADTAETLAEALATLRERPYDGIVVGADLVAGDGDALAALRGAARDRELPLLLLVDEEPADVVLGALRQGVADFVPKPFPVELVRARVLGAIARRRLERRVAEGSA
jgi:DNA-binding response OmpR family regulator